MNRICHLSPVKCFLYALFSVLIMQVAFAQDSTINSQLWIDYYTSFYISEELQFAGDAGYRTILDEESWRLVLLRPGVRYRLNNTIELNGGLGLFYEFNIGSSDRFELRPWQGIRIYWPKFSRIKLTRFNVNHWIRLEERISFLTEDSWDSSFDVRLRYKLSGKINLCLECSNPKWSLPLYGEIFISSNDIDEIFRNQSRAGMGLDYDSNKYWSFGFMFHWQGSRSGEDEDIKISDYIFQFKILHRFDKKPWFFGL